MSVHPKYQYGVIISYTSPKYLNFDLYALHLTLIEDIDLDDPDVSKLTMCSSE